MVVVRRARKHTVNLLDHPEDELIRTQRVNNVVTIEIFTCCKKPRMKCVEAQ